MHLLSVHKLQTMFKIFSSISIDLSSLSCYFIFSIFFTLLYSYSVIRTQPGLTRPSLSVCALSCRSTYSNALSDPVLPTQNCCILYSAQKASKQELANKLTDWTTNPFTAWVTVIHLNGTSPSECRHPSCWHTKGHIWIEVFPIHYRLAYYTIHSSSIKLVTLPFCYVKLYSWLSTCTTRGSFAGCPSPYPWICPLTFKNKNMRWFEIS